MAWFWPGLFCLDFMLRICVEFSVGVRVEKPLFRRNSWGNSFSLAGLFTGFVWKIPRLLVVLFVESSIWRLFLLKPRVDFAQFLSGFFLNFPRFLYSQIIVKSPESVILVSFMFFSLWKWWIIAMIITVTKKRGIRTHRPPIEVLLEVEEPPGHGAPPFLVNRCRLAVAWGLPPAGVRLPWQLQSAIAHSVG